MKSISRLDSAEETISKFEERDNGNYPNGSIGKKIIVAFQ